MSLADLQKAEERRQELASAILEVLSQLNEVDKTTSRLRNEGTDLLKRLITEWPTKPEFEERVVEAVANNIETNGSLVGILRKILNG